MTVSITASCLVGVVVGAIALQPPAGLGHRIFEPSGAVEQDDTVVRTDPPVSKSLLICRVGRRGFGTEQQPFLLRDLAPRPGDRLVSDRNRKPAAVTHS